MLLGSGWLAGWLADWLVVACLVGWSGSLIFAISNGGAHSCVDAIVQGPFFARSYDGMAKEHLSWG